MTVKEYTWAGNANSPSWPTIYVTKADYDALVAELAVAKDAQNIVTVIDERMGKGWTRDLAHSLFTNAAPVRTGSELETDCDHVCVHGVHVREKCAQCETLSESATFSKEAWDNLIPQQRRCDCQTYCIEAKLPVDRYCRKDREGK